ncbi:cytoplasmic dynein 2 heavy chain 1 [Exaiptasia diaphana]|uniref:Dynein heavy chain tail domain-containing protein n=1 Tax=Exaiptasia diaphana TaxID=2652724 RepID=A0A913XTJ2_EXADI|nr:cytoplasmic dynein 2 heavy chain 1 [Exaiptasia diaphana]
MKKAVLVCERWVSTCETLTSQYWKRFPSHPWKDDKFVPERLSLLATRLEEVLTLRTVHEQLVRLLSQQERQQLRTSDAFVPFAGLNPLHQNPYTEPLWRAAVGQYERGMAPAEQKIAGKLRQQFRDLSAQSHQLLREFQRYKELVKRPSISKELAPER